MFHRLFVLAGIRANWIEISRITEGRKAKRKSVATIMMMVAVVGGGGGGISWKRVKMEQRRRCAEKRKLWLFPDNLLLHLTMWIKIRAIHTHTHSHKITSACDSLIWLDFMESAQSNFSSAITYCLSNYACSIQSTQTHYTWHIRCEAKKNISFLSIHLVV